MFLAGCHAALEAAASPARSSLRDSSVRATPPSMSELLEIRLLGPFEVLAGETARGRRRLEAPGAAGDARAAERPDRRRRLARRRPLGRRAPVGSAKRAPSSRRPPSRRARRGVDRRLSRRLRAKRRTRRRGRVRGAARRRRAPRCATATSGRGGRGRVGAGPLARTGAAGPDRHGVVRRRGAPARDAARRRARGAVRGQRSRSESTAS